MNKELELKLVEKYPKILQDYGGDKMKTCMAWGMECGDGWYDLLDDLLAKLDYLSNLSGVQVVADQIKEKYGTLRFYYHKVGGDYKLLDYIIDNIIDMAEKRSANICEKTGKNGTVCSRMGWLKTLNRDEANKDGYTPTNPQKIKLWDELDSKSLNEDS